MDNTPHIHTVDLYNGGGYTSVTYGDTTLLYSHVIPWKGYMRWRLRGFIRKAIRKHDSGSRAVPWQTEAASPIRQKLTARDRWGSEQL